MNTKTSATLWIWLGFILAGLIAGTADLPAQEKTPQFEATAEALAPGLYEIRIPPVNLLALIGPDGALLVDAGYEQMGEALAAEAEKLGKNPIRFIINTHWHFDHVGGNIPLGKGALIIAHESVRELLSADQSILGNEVRAHPRHAVPSLVFEESLTLHLNGEEVVITALPGGHTGGDITVLFKKANVMHIGDIVFADQFPFVDLDHGGDVVRLAENIRTIIDTGPQGVTLVPGHGRRLTVDDLKTYREMILATTDAVRKAMAEGIALEAMKEADILKDFSDWDGSFTRSDWIEYIHAGLSK